MEGETERSFVPANDQELLDHALGAVAGAFIGDSCGGVLEFMDERAIENNMSRAMNMNGGGFHLLEPAQITDDSEMAMSLADGIVRSLCREEFTPYIFGHSIVSSYKRWVKSEPFDIGITTRRGLEMHMNREDPTSVSRLYMNNLRVNGESISNGCIMRLSPMAVWLASFYRDNYLKDETSTLKRVICATMLDTFATHSNPTAVIISAVYCVYITHLIASKYPKKSLDSAVYACVRTVKLFPRSFMESKRKIERWISRAIREPKYKTMPNEGFAKYGFSHAFTCTHFEKSFKKALSKIISSGGDTDTNAAIGLAAYGAMVGLSGIDEFYVKKLDDAKTIKRGEIDFTSSNYRRIVEVLVDVQATKEDLDHLLQDMGGLEPFAAYRSMWDNEN